MLFQVINFILLILQTMLNQTMGEGIIWKALFSQLMHASNIAVKIDYLLHSKLDFLLLDHKINNNSYIKSFQ